MIEVLSKIITALIRLYQSTLGGIFGGNCRFHPSCSEYAIQAVQLEGPFLGSIKALCRILRCGPWSSGGVDYPSRGRRPKEAAHG